ncbi:VacJ family lipoprotein [uncultured Paracoccus sp.]|uniref:MlaA family lipoprotein n=1 Tax=uncultured Paracoccus sp. TaxID=189685 RepID=UPI00261249D7|nr:VacJ family lipoprotein [uncultured Paracoccus sp.]
MHACRALSRAATRLAATLLIAGCAAQAPSDPEAVNDPFEAANRRVHAFNKGVDTTLIRPLTGGKEDEAVAGGAAGEADGGAMDVLGNVGANLSLPGKVLNQILQGRPGPALKSTARFAVNSTLGLGGLHDPAGREFALTEVDTDFGETLHVWGVPEGAYLELPVLGPSTMRDATGKVVDLVIDPWDVWLDEDEYWASFAIRAASKAGERARFGDTVDSVLYESADSYSQLRLIYLMHRRHELSQGGASEDPYVIDPYETEPAAAATDAFVIDPYEE